ncbi:MAG: winged helix-turn-helix domain-containing protein [Acidobacteriales bacterium]|nr:winged helix-turn-helix domain-containing protein [Terriglobales bacterium]
MATEKPASPAESPASIRRFSVYELDVRTGELRKNGMRLRLQEQPFQVLAMLLERPGELVTRDDLRQKLWPADTFVDFDHGLNTAVNKLREVLADSAASPRYIETLPKRGYRFIYPVESTPTPPAPATKPEPTPATVEPTRGSRTLPRVLFLLLQMMYLAIYVAALAKLGRVEEILTLWFGNWGNEATIAVLLTAALGVAVRLFLLNATAFDFSGLGQLFRRMFWPIFALDLIWSLSPFLLAHKIGVGLSFAAFATMVWLPFSQRTLIRMAYGKTS